MKLSTQHIALVFLTMALFSCAIPTETLDRRRLDKQGAELNPIKKIDPTAVPTQATCDIPSSKLLNPRRAFKPLPAFVSVPKSCCLAASDLDLDAECLSYLGTLD